MVLRDSLKGRNRTGLGLDEGAPGAMAGAGSAGLGEWGTRN